MTTLYNNIVSDIFHSGVCVDFLGTYITSLVLFFGKPGVTPTLTNPEHNIVGEKTDEILVRIT
jgi:hypothetical protein